MIVTVLGAGMMGTAIAFPFADSGHDVRLVGSPLDGPLIDGVNWTGVHTGLGLEMASGIRAYRAEELDQAIDGTELVLLGVSSAGIPWASSILCEHLRAGVPIAMITKGLERFEKSLRIFPDAIAAALGPHIGEEVFPVAVGGPCIAGELARRRPSALILSSRDLPTANAVASAMRAPYVRAIVSDDPAGVCICSALKNAYAVAVGIPAGLLERKGGPSFQPGPVAMHNLEAAVFARALCEMELVVVSLGGRAETVPTLAGAGDLYVTCQGGRSSRLGRLLGLGRSLAEARAELSVRTPVTLEGVEIATQLHEALGELEASGALPRHDLRLLEVLYGILFDDAPADSIFDAVLTLGSTRRGTADVMA